jgi:hypothetical protein
VKSGSKEVRKIERARPTAVADSCLIGNLDNHNRDPSPVFL